MILKFFKKLFSLTSIYSLGELSQKAITFFLLPVYTIYLSPKDFGILALMNLTISFITGLISFPVHSGLNRFFYNPSYKEKNDVLLFNLFLFIFCMSLILMLVYLYFNIFITRIFFNTSDFLPIVRFYALLVFLIPLSSFMMTFIQLIQKAKYYLFISLCSMAVSSGLVLYLLISFKMGIMAVIMGQALNQFLLLMAALPVFYKYSRFELSIKTIKFPLTYGYPFLLTGYSNILMQSGDRYVLRFFSSVATVGLYEFGYRISSLIKMILVEPLQKALTPLLFQEEHNPAAQKRYLRTGATYYYFIAVFCALILSLFAKELVMLIARRQEFWDSWKIISIIAFSYVFHGLGGYLNFGIIMRNKSGLIAFNTFIAAGLNIGLNFLFIPLWGIMGAAVATLISYLVWDFLRVYFSARLYDLHFELMRLLKITIVGCGLYLAAMYLTLNMPIYQTVALKIVFLSIYFPAFFVIGFFDAKEMQYIKSFFSSVKNSGIASTIQKIRKL